jgi:hypothetical protein
VRGVAFALAGLARLASLVTLATLSGCGSCDAKDGSPNGTGAAPEAVSAQPFNVAWDGGRRGRGLFRSRSSTDAQVVDAGP